MNRLFFIILSLLFIVEAKGQTFIGADDGWYYMAPKSMVLSTMNNLGFQTGAFTYGYFFYKNTQIKLADQDNGSVTPEFLHPKTNACLLIIFEKNGTVFHVMSCCKSKAMVQNWISELKRCQYKSTGASPGTNPKTWTYSSPTSSYTYELTYFQNDGNYLLRRKMK